MLIETCHYSNVSFIDIVHRVVNFDFDFTLLPGVPVHSCFHTLNLNVSCQFNVSFVDEAPIVFSMTWVNSKVLSILNVILLWYMMHQMSIISFRLKFKL